MGKRVGKDMTSGMTPDDGPKHDAVGRGAHDRGKRERPKRALAPISAIPASAIPPCAHADDPRAAPLAARQERALALLCQGLRPPAIAALLGTTPGTVRRWLRKRFEGIQREAREEHATALLRAIEAQREIARAAWEAFEHERSVEAAVLRGELDRVKRRAVRRTGRQRPGRAIDVRPDQPDRADGEGPGAEPDAGDELLVEEFERPRLPAQGARYLALAQSAEREMARLQGLYDELAEPSGQISITITRRPEGPENFPPEERAALIAAGWFGPAAPGAQADAGVVDAAEDADDAQYADGEGADIEGEGLP